MVSLENIRAAHEAIKKEGRGLCSETPVLTSPRIDRQLSERVGRKIEVFFKAEHLQPVGSFKIRGALNFALCLEPSMRAKGLVTHSSGNHGIAVAEVGRFLGTPVVVVAPRDAPSGKIERILDSGAEVIFCEATLSSRESHCAEVVRIRGMSEVPPFNHPWTINGQGTLALELIEQVPDLDAILVAVGGCGLMSGVITVAKSSARNVQVFGAEPLAFDDTKASLAEDRRRGPTDPSATSICDALRVSPPGEICWDIIRGKCSGVFTAGDSATIRAMQMLMTDLKQVTEPSGAIATAVLFSDDFVNMLNADDRIKRIAVVICGANIGLDVLKRYT